ncbi:MAG: AzlC family ABC transporter permease [Leptolyngbyaceae cyanobacterium bins.302]|nr:AzlC family ABC transporter permease [Leptolyngbyaceae cyanobacterium bins.302]
MEQGDRREVDPPCFLGNSYFKIGWHWLGRVTATLAMSAVVFAGSAQLIALGLLATGTPLLLIWLTTLIVNLRHLLYALSLSTELLPGCAGECPQFIHCRMTIAY